jgi:hypothetical protein
MAYLVLVLNCPTLSIDQINSKCDADATLPREGCADVVNLIDAIRSGLLPVNIQFTSRDVDPGVTTSGTDSLQKLWSLL